MRAQLAGANAWLFKKCQKVLHNNDDIPRRYKYLGFSRTTDKLNKRAMMALDRSPESFSPQTNSTSLFPTNELYIFVALVQTCDPWGGASFDPKGHHMNKIDKGLQGCYIPTI